MNTIKSFLLKLLIGITALGFLAGLVWTVSPVLTASAASDPTGQPNPTAPGSQKADAPQGALRLALAFQHEHLVQIRQGANLNRADRLTERVQALINRLRDAGKDVAPLEQALVAFNTSITTARGQHDQAGVILANHPGFDDNGKVTDLAAARQTVKDIHNLQVQIRQTIQPAFNDLKTVLKNYRQPNASQTNNN